jgi:excisionase family DNA binding protein
VSGRSGWTRILPLDDGLGGSTHLVAETMAGKFLTVDEAAQRLGVSAEEVQRLVDRKELYPVRDGTTLKFKHDDIERYAADAGAASGGNSGLSLDLDAAAEDAGGLDLDGIAIDAPAASGLEIDLGDSLQIDAAAGGVTGSGAPAAATADGLSLDAELELGDGPAIAPPGTSPSPPPGQEAGPAAPPEPITGTLPIDLSGISMGGAAESGSNATGSIVSGSGANAMDLSGVGSNVGSALSGVMQGGLSLEDSDARKSGILSDPDFESGMESAIKSASISASDARNGPRMSGLAGEEIEEFAPAPDDDDTDSAVVTEDVSSFVDDGSESFSTGLEDESSEIGLSTGTDIESRGLDDGAALLPDTSFSVWQVCFLVCCALIMLTGCFLMYDLVRTIGSTDELNRSSPLLNPMADLFGWRR